jgi:hypothetical protein
MTIDHLLADFEAQLAAEARDGSASPAEDERQARARFANLARLEVQSGLGRTLLEPGIVGRDAVLGVNDGQLVVLPLNAVDRVKRAPTLRPLLGDATGFGGVTGLGTAQGLGSASAHPPVLRDILREWLGEQVSLTLLNLPREAVVGRLVSVSKRCLIINETSADVLIPLPAVLAVRLCTTSAELEQTR